MKSLSIHMIFFIQPCLLFEKKKNPSHHKRVRLHGPSKNVLCERWLMSIQKKKLACYNKLILCVYIVFVRTRNICKLPYFANMEKLYMEHYSVFNFFFSIIFFSFRKRFSASNTQILYRASATILQIFYMRLSARM